MQSDQLNIWPAHLPKTLDVPQQPLNYYLDRTAAQTPEKPATIFYDAVIQYGQLKQYVDRLAGFLQHELNVQPGDRVLLMSQNRDRKSTRLNSGHVAISYAVFCWKHK